MHKDNMKNKKKANLKVGIDFDSLGDANEPIENRVY